MVFDNKGESIGEIPMDRSPANCAFGGPDNKTLFVTAVGYVYMIKMKVPGANVPGK
jgi:gluconolactonase